MWKALAALLVLVTIAAQPVAAADEGQYTDKYDSLDIDEILSNERLLNKYVQCLLDEGKERCTPEGVELKALLPELLQTDCAKCHPRQKARMDKIIKFVRDNRKDDWEKLKAKYDPDGTYYEKIERHLDETA